jgi:DNA-binding GntR family transcriptional regulator
MTEAGGSSAARSGEPGRRHAAERLRMAIAGGDMAPGQRLVEEELAEAFGVTRASLRAALFDLTAEALVERIPNRGARVRVVSVAEAIQITECRIALEGLCAAKAALNVTPEQAGNLHNLRDTMQQAVRTGDAVAYSALNAELHRTVRDISGQAVAAELLERLNAQLVRHRFRLSLRPGRVHESLPQHVAIIDAITSKNPVAAEEATRRHLTSVIDALKESA